MEKIAVSEFRANLVGFLKRVEKGRISIEAPYQDFIKLVLSSNKYKLQEITPEIAELSTKLSDEISKDPADRIIAATSLVMKNPLVTADTNLNQANSIKTIW